MTIKPMLAATADMKSLKYPLYASPKIDAVRGLVINGKLRSRSLKPIPNKYVSSLLSHSYLNGLDGEIAVGSPRAKDVYRQTQSALSRIDGAPVFTFWVFDNFTIPNAAFQVRYANLRNISNSYVSILAHKLIRSEKDLLAYEEQMLGVGYEGLILRDLHAPYKFGRSTVSEGGMLKLKRFVDSEAEIMEVVEEQENQNPATTSELGRTKRSSHKANKVPKGRAGALRVKDGDMVFDVGTGMNDKDKEWFWTNRKKAVGLTIKYKYFPLGMKDLPRHPVYLGPRDDWDMS